MATAVKRCRVCGKEYEACRSANRAAGVFRWQEVACSPECGSIYLQQINESRGIVDARKKNKHKKPVVAVPVVSELQVAEEILPDEAPAEIE